MPSRNSLGELELLVLLALLRLGRARTAPPFGTKIRERTGRNITPGAIYPTLDRLERKGLVRSYAGDPVPERGGRSKRHFVIERSGLAELRRAWGQYAALADGVERALRPGRAR